MSIPNFQTTKDFILSKGSSPDFPIYQERTKKTEDDNGVCYVRFIDIGRYRTGHDMYSVSRITVFQKGKREGTIVGIIKNNKDTWFEHQTVNERIIELFHPLLTAVLISLPDIKTIKA